MFATSMFFVAALAVTQSIPQMICANDPLPALLSTRTA